MAVNHALLLLEIILWQEREVALVVVELGTRVVVAVAVAAVAVAENLLQQGLDPQASTLRG